MSVFRRLVNVATGKVRLWQRSVPFGPDADMSELDAAVARARAHADAGLAGEPLPPAVAEPTVAEPPAEPLAETATPPGPRPRRL